MTANRLIFSNRLVWGLALLLCAGFMTTSWSGYQASRTSIRSAIIDTELPLTADNIYSEIRKDLVSPVLISSTMAQATYLRDWVIDGERDFAARRGAEQTVRAEIIAMLSSKPIHTHYSTTRRHWFAV